jgi:hypothetical protein
MLPFLGRRQVLELFWMFRKNIYESFVCNATRQYINKFQSNQTGMYAIPITLTPPNNCNNRCNKSIAPKLEVNQTKFALLMLRYWEPSIFFHLFLPGSRQFCVSLVHFYLSSRFCRVERFRCLASKLA